MNYKITASQEQIQARLRYTETPPNLQTCLQSYK